MKLKPLHIGDLTIPVPIIQGGMGVGISLSSLGLLVSFLPLNQVFYQMIF